MGPTSPARMAITVITTSSSISVKPLVRGDTQDLLHRRDFRLHFHPAVAPHQLHPLFLPQLAEAGERFAGRDGTIQGFGDDEQLEDADATEVAGAVASFAA